MSEINDKYSSASNGRSLRNLLISTVDTTPLLFVLSELKDSLKTSMDHWDKDNGANRMALNRMDTLIDTVKEVAFLTNAKGQPR
jgi:hypothetical protein